jgi:hypothetical protein
MSHRAANLHVTPRSAAITALAGTALCAGRGTGGSPDTSGSGPGPNAPVAGALQAQYRLTIGDDGDWYTLYEVITAAD